MAKNRLKFKLFLVLFLIVCHISGQYVSAEGDDDSDDEEEHTEKILKASAEEAEASEAPKESKSDSSGESDVSLQASKLGDIIKEKLEKAKKRKTPLDGSTGKVMKVVVEAIKEINPIRLLQIIDPNPLIEYNNIDVNKMSIPSTYFSDSFFDKMSTKTGISKSELSTELGANVEQRKEGEMVNIGAIFKIGKKKGLRLGDYLHFLGLDLQQYEKKYDDMMIETVRRPVEVIDELLSDGFKEYVEKIRNYVTKNGGPINAALQYYTDVSGKDPVQQTQQAIKDFKTQGKNAMKKREKMVDQQGKGWEEYMKEGEKQAKQYYQDTFGKKGTFTRIQSKVLKGINAYIKFLSTVLNTKRFKALIDLIGLTLGPTGRAIVYIVYQPSATYINQLFGPFLLIPRIMLADADLWDKLLALPVATIAMTGNEFKPLLEVGEPMLRWLRFIITGEYEKSLNAGLELSASFGISVWGTGVGKPITRNSKSESKPKPKAKKGKKRAKRDTKDSKVGGKFDKEVDRVIAHKYQGGPPPNGYELGVKKGTLDLADDDIVSRFLLSPDFLMKAGGPIFIPLASVLAPMFRAFNKVLFGKGTLDKRVAEVPKLIKGVGLIGPLADVIEALLPVSDIIYKINQGKMTPSDVVVQAPGLVKKLTSGVLWEVARKPATFIKAMLVWLEGSGGILGALKLQVEADPNKPKPPAHPALHDESNMVLDYLGDFAGGWFLGYVQSIGPIISIMGALFNGILGNIIDPVKFLDTNVNLKSSPLKHILQTFDNLEEMYECAEDRKSFVMALLGGQNPHQLKNVGIDSEKLVANGIDPALLLAGGKKMLPEEAQKKLNKESGLSSIGINVKLMVKIDVNVKQFLQTGLLEANEHKLQKEGIDFNSIMNRIMRGSIDDDIKLMNSGIDTKAMLKAGIDPAKFIAGGVGAIPDKTLKGLGVNGDKLSDDDLRKLGLFPLKLQSKGINAKKFAANGLQPLLVDSKLEANFGINIHVLMTSIHNGLDEKRMLKSGINLNTMVSAGIDTKLLLTGGLKKALNNDLSEKSLSKVGIDLKGLMKTDININLLAEVGAGVLNPTQLVKLGVDPMRVMIGTLSQFGLDMLTGGTDGSANFGLGVATSMIQIAQSMFGGIKKLRSYSFGKSIFGPDGRWVGLPGLFFYKIIGIDTFGGLLGFCKTAFLGKLTMAEMLQLVNPVRIVKELAYPEKQGTFRRKKDSRKHEMPDEDDDIDDHKSKIYKKGDKDNEKDGEEKETKDEGKDTKSKFSKAFSKVGSSFGMN